MCITNKLEFTIVKSKARSFGSKPPRVLTTGNMDWFPSDISSEPWYDVCAREGHLAGKDFIGKI